MATILSDLGTKNALGARGDLSTALVNADDACGTILYATVRFASQTFGVSDILELVPANLVPIGSVVAPELCTVWCSATGGVTAMNIGTTSSASAYANALAPVAVTVKSWATSGTGPAQTTGTANAAIRVTTQEAIIATLTNGTPVAAAYVFRVAYIAKA